MTTVLNVELKLTKEEQEKIVNECLDILNDRLVEELEKILDKIDFEEKWLINIKMDNGFISIADVQIAMGGIRRVISELKGENK